MPYSAKIIVLREDKPVIDKSIGSVIDILPSNTFSGIEVNKLKRSFVTIHVNDLDEALGSELKKGSKRLKVPKVITKFYIDLDVKGETTATNAELLNYVENV